MIKTNELKENMEKLFTSLFGSRLYGTQTPTSDLDIKHIYLPSLDDMLIGKQLANKVKKTNNEKNTRNGMDDIDEEFLPLQIFARDFLNGQTYALEMTFAVDGTHAKQQIYGTDFQATLYRQFIYELRTKFLTSNVKSLMGYAVNQVSLYSFKGERLNAVREVQSLLRKTANTFSNRRLSDYMLEDKQFTQMIYNIVEKYPKYFQETTYDVGGGDMRPCFKLLDKTLPFSDRAGQVSRVVEALEKRYGTRTNAASADNIDWKATMHAIRIIDEGLQLLEFGTLSFPFNQTYIDYLLNIKHGNIDLALIKKELDEKFERLKMLEQTTFLRPLTQELKEEFDKWLAQWMRIMYSL